MALSIDAEKSFDNIPHVFTIRVLENIGLERTHLKIIEDKCENPQLTPSSLEKHLKQFPELKNKTGLPTAHSFPMLCSKQQPEQ